MRLQLLQVEQMRLRWTREIFALVHKSPLPLPRKQVFLQIARGKPEFQLSPRVTHC